MRALQYIIISFIFISFLSLVSFFVAREVLLYWSQKNISKSLTSLHKAQLSGSYSQECLRKGSQIIGDNESVVTLQLRFISSTEYMLEAVCQQFSFDPIVIDRGELPPLVQKVPGTSGFIINEHDPSAITLGVFDEYIDEFNLMSNMDFSFLRKHILLSYADDELEKGDDTQYYQQGPVTSCTGYGFQCCQTASETGIGERIVGLNDCSDSCYAQCVPRPIVLNFASDPLINPIDRTVTVSTGSQVDFSYLANDAREGDLRAIIEFGDGARTEVPHAQGVVTHTYSCPNGGCRFVAKITLYDSWNVESADTAQSKMTIVVN